MARIQELSMPGGNRALLLIALVAGAIAAAVVFVAVSNSDDGGGTPVVSGSSQAVVASQSISPGDELTADNLKVVDVPNDLLVSGSYDEVSLVEGEVAKVAIASGEQITTGKVGVPVPDKGLAGVIQPGMRAVSIKVEEVTAVGGLLLPTDRVDVVAAYRIGRAAGLQDDEYILRTETILQNVEVLSVAQEAQDASAGTSTDTETADTTVPASGQLPDDVEEQPGAGTITVALTPQQAQVLIAKQEHAQRVWVVERAFGDDSISDVQPLEIVIVE